jgi:glycosyltransferase involved in cell wall biosynthesis
MSPSGKNVMPKITVAIPTYNREKVLIDTINDVLTQSEKKIELLIIDQSETHTSDTYTALDAINDPRFHYYRVRPASLPAARNFALSVAAAPYILFLDDDIKLPTQTVAKYIKTFKDHPDISAVAGRVLQKGFPKLPLLKFDEFAISHGGYTGDDPGFTNSFPGGNHALRVKEALAIGGFDTRYYGTAFREESDMAIRMTKLGYKIYYQPSAKILHLAAPTGGTRVKTPLYDSFSFYKNELFFTLRMADRGKKLVALRRKFHEYCIMPHNAPQKRKWFFRFGLVAALWRIAFGRQREAKELL